MKILLVEDDDASIALLTRSLQAQHHIVDAVKDGEMGWTYASTFDYQAIVLDIMLPKLDGISLCKKLRGAGYTTPILLLTSQDNTTAKVQGLDAGADDYMVKPFETPELIARVRALLRRGGSNPLPLLSWGDLLLDPSSCEVTYNGQSLSLTTKEYDLLELFLRDTYRVFSSEEIIDRLWSSDDYPAEATVRSHLRRLRSKLQAAGAPPDSIATMHGRGYHLKSLQSVGRGDGGTIDRNTVPLLSQQQQYQDFLAETWVTTKPQLQERLLALQSIVDRLANGTSNYADRQQAYQAAHKLVGTLGVFTMTSAMEIARQIEVILERSTIVPTPEANMLPTLAIELMREIESNAPTQPRSPATTDWMATSHSHLPLLLLVDLPPTYTASLPQIATQRGCRTTILDTIAAAENYLDTAVDEHLPAAILVGLDNGTPSIGKLPLLNFIDRLSGKFPVGGAAPEEHRAVLVLSDSDDLTARLEVVRHGGKFLGTNGLTIEQIFAAATSLLQPANAPVKIMVVDDDLDWLRALPPLLAPWAMKLTTLADPHQFWAILQSVRPDALVLDLKMPEINGLEICQVLRSDPHWRYLPILFLTAANDPIAQQEAFKVGADDYLCKPIGGGELAQRIRHRLARSCT
jgi:DNA-binding response OmpR family regulator